MKKITLFTIALLSIVECLKAEVVVSDSLIDAIAIVESNNDNTKIGSFGELGILQIRQCVIDDVNKVYNTQYTINDTKDNEKSREICKKYLKYWGECYEKKTGLKATDQILAKIWNGGPSAPTRKHSRFAKRVRRYWKRVKQYMA